MKSFRLVYALVLCAGCPSTSSSDTGSETSSGSTSATSSSTAATSSTDGSSGSGSEAGTSVEPPPPGEECVMYDNEADCLAAGCTAFRSPTGDGDFALVGVEDDACVDVRPGVCLSFPGAVPQLSDYPICYGMPAMNLGFCSLLFDTTPTGWVDCRDVDPPSVCAVCYGYGTGTSTGGSDTGATDTGGSTTTGTSTAG